MKSTIRSTLLIMAVLLVAVLAACAVGPSPHNQPEPDIVQSFNTDHMEMALCIYDDIASNNPAAANMLVRSDSKVEVTARMMGLVGLGRVVTHYVIEQVRPNEVRVEYRGQWVVWWDYEENDSWLLVLRCAEKAS